MTQQKTRLTKLEKANLIYSFWLKDASQYGDYCNWKRRIDQIEAYIKRLKGE